MKPHLPILLLLAGAILVARAATPEPAAPAVGKIDFGPKSAFSPGGITRNPFTPIGWVKPQSKQAGPQATPVAVVEVPADAFQLTTVLLGTPPLAVVNGREVSVGDTLQFSPKSGSATVELKVLAIGDGFIELDHLGRRIKVRQQRIETSAPSRRANP